MRNGPFTLLEQSSCIVRYGNPQSLFCSGQPLLQHHSHPPRGWTHAQVRSSHGVEKYSSRETVSCKLQGQREHIQDVFDNHLMHTLTNMTLEVVYFISYLLYFIQLSSPWSSLRGNSQVLQLPLQFLWVTVPTRKSKRHRNNTNCSFY